jgi:hypothetical protein
VLFSRLLTKLEHPERRPVAEYRHPELLKWVRETRPGFVGAALTVLRAWYVAGKPSCGCERLETFEEWSALVPPAIVHAGGLDPLACRLLVGGDADDHESQAEYALVALLQNFGDAGTSVAHLVDVLFRGMSGQPAIWHADLREALIALAPPRPGCREPSSEQVAGVLRRLKDQVLDGLVLEAKPGVHSAVRWCVRTVGGYEVVEVVSAAGPENGSGGSGGSGASTAKISAKGGSNLRNLVTSPRLTGRFAAINAVTPPRGDP